jgi:outer membrane cobalamin receptor
MRRPPALTRSWIAIVWLVLAARASASSQDLDSMSLEELLDLKIVTTSKSLERMREAVDVVTVVTAREIEEMGAVNLVDVLNRLPSVQLLSSHLWVQAKPVIRGNLITHADHHTLVLINGRPFRDALESNSNLALYQAFPLGLIERIEVVRGPGSVLYGSNAVAGVVNVITKKSGARRRTELSAGGGSFGAEMASLDSYWSGEDWTLALGMSHFEEQGWTLSANTNHPNPALGIRESRLDYAEDDLSGAAFFDYKDRFTAQLVYNDIRYAEMGVLPHWLFQGEAGGKRYFLDLGYTQPLGRGWKLTSNVTVNDWEKFTIDGTASANSTDEVRATVVELAASGQIGPRTRMIVGALNERKENRDLQEIVPFVHTAAVAIPFREDHPSAYVQVDHRLTDALKLVGGLQYHRTDSGESGLLPRAGIIYDLSEAMTLKLLYGESFRTATPLEEYIDLPGVLEGNQDLVPEKGMTVASQLFLATEKGRFTFTAFRNSFDDIIERHDLPNGSGAQTFANTGHVDTWGLELEGKHYLNEWMYLIGNLTYQNEREGGLYVPDSMGKIGLGYTRGRFSGGVFYSRFGKPREAEATLGGLQLNDPVSEIDMLTANLTYRFARPSNLSVTLYGTNLLDDPMSYTEFSKGWVNSLPIGPPRAGYGSVRISF